MEDKSVLEEVIYKDQRLTQEEKNYIRKYFRKDNRILFVFAYVLISIGTIALITSVAVLRIYLSAGGIAGLLSVGVLLLGILMLLLANQLSERSFAAIESGNYQVRNKIVREKYIERAIVSFKGVVVPVTHYYILCENDKTGIRIIEGKKIYKKIERGEHVKVVDIRFKYSGGECFLELVLKNALNNFDNTVQ